MPQGEAIFANHQICMQFILVMTNKSISELLRKLMKQFPVPVDPKSRIPMWKMIISRFFGGSSNGVVYFQISKGNILSIWLKSSLDNRNSSCYTCTHTNSVQMMLIYEMSLKYIDSAQHKPIYKNTQKNHREQTSKWWPDSFPTDFTCLSFE